MVIPQNRRRFLRWAARVEAALSLKFSILAFRRPEPPPARTLLDCQVAPVPLGGGQGLTAVAHLLMTPAGPELRLCVVHRLLSDAEAEAMKIKPAIED